MRPKILFDLSEVLIAGFYGFERVIAESESVPREKVKPVVAGPHLAALCSGAMSEDEYLERVRQEGGWQKMTKAEMARSIRELFKETVPGMPEYLALLSHSCDLYLLSDHAREWIPDVVNVHPFLKLFKRRYYSFEAGGVKRQGTPFLFVLKDLGLKPHELLFIDDSTANVEAARKCGLEAVVFKSRVDLEPVVDSWIRQQRAAKQ